MEREAANVYINSTGYNDLLSMSECLKFNENMVVISLVRVNIATILEFVKARFSIAKPALFQIIT